MLDWARAAGGTGRDAGFSVAVDDDGTTWLAGGFEYEITLGTGELRETAFTSVSPASYDIFLAQYEPDGMLAWAKHGGIGAFATFGRGERNEIAFERTQSGAMFIARYQACPTR